VIVGSEIMCDKILNYLLSINNHHHQEDKKKNEKEEMFVEEEEVKSENDMKEENQQPSSQSQQPSHNQPISIKINSKVFEMKHEGGFKMMRDLW